MPWPSSSATRLLGRSLIADPEGHVRQQTHSTEEVVTDVLDLDAVTRVRTHGSFGLNRTWDQLDRHGPDLELPPYGGYVPRAHALAEDRA